MFISLTDKCSQAKLETSICKNGHNVPQRWIILDLRMFLIITSICPSRTEIRRYFGNDNPKCVEDLALETMLT